MSEALHGFELKTYPPYSAICRAGETDTDLYIIASGTILVCVNKGSEVTPLAYLSEGEYFGELSFFDRQTRSANAVAITETKLIKIPFKEVKGVMPDWLIRLAEAITKKIRHSDEVIRQKGIKRQNAQTIKPLSIEDQRSINKILQKS
jgi:CRP-like cAMP-binding protein